MVKVSPASRFDDTLQTLLGGSGVVISRVISPLIWVISIITLLVTLLISTHEPPSTLNSVTPEAQTRESKVFDVLPF